MTTPAQLRQLAGSIDGRTIDGEYRAAAKALRQAADEIERLTLEAQDAERRTESWQELNVTYREAIRQRAEAERLREERRIGESYLIHQKAKLEKMRRVVEAARHRADNGGHSKFCSWYSDAATCSCGHVDLDAALAALDQEDT